MSFIWKVTVTFPPPTKNKKKISEKGDIVLTSANLFKFGLIEDSWIFISSALNLLQYVVLMEMYKENQASHKYVVRGKKGVF